MKRFLISLCALGLLAANATADGYFELVANPANGLIQYTKDGINLIPIPTSDPGFVPGLGLVNIGVMAAPDGTPLSLVNGLPDYTGAWVESTVINNRAIINGKTTDTIRFPAPLAPNGGNVEVSVVAWTGSATTWQQAISGGATALAFTGSLLSGGALEWSQPTGDPNSIPVPDLPTQPVTGPEGFNGLVLVPTPEAASTLLLSMLAALGMWSFGKMRTFNV